MSSHSFDTQIAERIGVENAVLINNLAFWLKKNSANGTNFFDGRIWTFNSAKALAELFPYWSSKKIGRMLSNLESDGVIMSGNYNSSAYDRTKWYTIADKSISLTYELHIPNVRNGVPESVQPIPDINTDINTDREENTKEPEQAPVVCLKDDCPEQFNAIWILYGIRGSKKQALAQWKKLGEQDKDDAVASVSDFIKEVPTTDYRPHFFRYLRDRVFESVLERKAAGCLNIPKPEMDAKTQAMFDAVDRMVAAETRGPTR